MTITTREEIEEDGLEDDDDGEGRDLDHSMHHQSGPSSYRDELLTESPFPSTRSYRKKYRSPSNHSE